MEILSTGDKIRRARIYEGITLKELCQDKISISKMSCIENGKIKADEETLRYIAMKLGVSYDYLVQDVRGQIEENIKIIEKGSLIKKELLELIEYNLKYCIKCEYYDLAFKIIHELFSIYEDCNNLEHMQLIMAQYYDIYQKNEIKDNTIIYYKDMAKFFMKIKEYYEAINYYDKILTMVEKDNFISKDEHINIFFNKAICYMKLGEMEKAYFIIDKNISDIDSIKEVLVKGNIYNIFACLSIVLNKVNAEDYIRKSYELLKEDSKLLSKSKARVGRFFYKIGNTENGKKEVLDAINIVYECNSNEYIDILIECVEILYTYKEFEVANEVADRALNLSICSEDSDLIQKSYYFKGMILQKKGLYIQAETYMNISTDYFLKYANTEDTYKRYMEMGELYYNISEPREAIKYFTLAMNLIKD